MFAAAMPSPSSVATLPGVAARCSELTCEISLRLLSSGNGLSISPVLRPASIWITGTARKRALSAPASALVVSPWTITAAGRWRSITLSIAEINLANSSFNDWFAAISSSDSSISRANPRRKGGARSPCCPVDNRITRSPGSLSSARKTGISLIISGRVPNTVSMGAR